MTTTSVAALICRRWRLRSLKINKESNLDAGLVPKLTKRDCSAFHFYCTSLVPVVKICRMKFNTGVLTARIVGIINTIEQCYMLILISPHPKLFDCLVVLNVYCVIRWYSCSKSARSVHMVKHITALPNNKALSKSSVEKLLRHFKVHNVYSTSASNKCIFDYFRAYSYLPC